MSPGGTIHEEPREETSSGTKPKHQPEPQISGQAEMGECDAGEIEELCQDPDTALPSSILSLSGQPRKSRKTKGRRERKAEQLRRKVLALSPERREEARKEEQQQQQQQTSRDQSPAVSDRSAASAALRDMIAQAKREVARPRQIIIMPEGTRRARLGQARHRGREPCPRAARP